MVRNLKFTFGSSIDIWIALENFMIEEIIASKVSDDELWPEKTELKLAVLICFCAYIWHVYPFAFLV